jgi:hypothetical protein
MRWRGSRLRRWITWLRNLLRLREGLDFDWPSDSESDSVHQESQRSRRQRLFRKEMRHGLRPFKTKPLMSDFRKAGGSGPQITVNRSFRTSLTREDLSSDRTFFQARSYLIASFKRLNPKTQIQAQIRSLQTSAAQTVRPERGRVRSLQVLRSMAETSLQNQPEQSLIDSRKPESATFSPPFSTRLRHKPKPAKPGREPPLWLSFGPHLARQLKQ